MFWNIFVTLVTGAIAQSIFGTIWSITFIRMFSARGLSIRQSKNKENDIIKKTNKPMRAIDLVKFNATSSRFDKKLLLEADN